MTKCSRSILPLLICLAGPMAASCSLFDRFTEKSAADIDRENGRVRLALVAAGDPDSLAAAALMGGSSGDGTESMRLLMAAVDAAPGRRDLAWLLLQKCLLDPQCDVRPAQAHLQSIDAGNGAAWAGSLLRAGQAKDETGVATALTAISQSQRFDIHWNSSVVHLAHALDRVPATRPSENAIAAIGIMAAIAIPQYAQFGSSCTVAALAKEGALETCRGLSNVLRKGDAIITESIGLRIAGRVWPKESPEYRDAMQDRRRLDYQLQWKNERAGEVVRAEYPIGLLERLSKFHSEQEAMAAELVEAGIDPAPPPGWIGPTRRE